MIEALEREPSTPNHGRSRWERARAGRSCDASEQRSSRRLHRHPHSARCASVPKSRGRLRRGGVGGGTVMSAIVCWSTGQDKDGFFGGLVYVIVEIIEDPFSAAYGGFPAAVGVCAAFY